MGFTYLVVIALAVLTLRKRFTAPRFFDRVPAGVAAKVAYAALLVASLACELSLLERREFERSFLPAVAPGAFADIFGIISIVQTLVLGALYVALSRRSAKGDLAIVLACGAAMLCFGLGFVNSWGDVLVYVANGMLPNPYRPQAVPFPAGFERLNTLLGTPILASPYGPLEQAISRALDATSQTLAGRVHAFQVFGAIALVVTALAVRARGCGIAVWAMVLCNPFLIRAYVAEAHNDLHGIAFLALAAIAPVPLAIALVAASSAIKISLGAVGLVVLVRVRDTRKRLVAVAVTVLACAAIFATVGPQYVAAIRSVAVAWAQPVDPFARALHGVAIVTIAVAVAASLLRGKFNPGAAWATIALGQFPLDNYLGWGLPAAIAGDALAVYLTTLPYAQYEVTNIIVTTTAQWVVRGIVLVAILTAIVVRPRVKASKPFPRDRRYSDSPRTV